MPSHPRIEVNKVEITWDLERGDLGFFGIDSVLFWTDPSMIHLLAPLVDEIGVELFRLLVAHSSSLGTDADYEVMVTKLGHDFLSGFLAWGEAVSAAGWGRFSVPAFDPIAGTAHVRVLRPWELQTQRNHPTPWGCPFLQGKIIGLFSHAFARPCWADEQVWPDADQPCLDLYVHPSERGLKRELTVLRRARMAEKESELMHRVDEATVDLRAKLATIEAQRAVIAGLACPILEVWSGVLTAVVGRELGAPEVRELSRALLERVAATGAADVILDCSAVVSPGAAEVDALTGLVATLRHCGTRTTLVGASPRLAAGADPLLRTVADALERVIGLRRGA